MRLTMKEKNSVTKAIASRYQKASKKQKGIILDEFTQLTGYTRCYASYLLASHGKRIRVSSNIVIVGDLGKKTKRNRHRIYDSRVLSALKKIWLTYNGLHLWQEACSNAKGTHRGIGKIWGDRA
jgi:hypothetical protein